jgi:hypothetical protein
MNPTLPRAYGIVVDYHAPREDAGVPAFWDGWYSDRSLAEAALAYWKAKWPRAHVNLVAQLTPSTSSEQCG